MTTAFDAKLRGEFIRRVRDLEQKAVDNLCLGRMEDFAEYKHWTGYLSALREVFEALESARKAVLNEGRLEDRADSTDENT